VVISRTSLLLSLSLMLGGNTSFAMYDTASQQPVNTQPAIGWGVAAKEYGVPFARSAACTATGAALGLYLALNIQGERCNLKSGAIGLGTAGGSLLAYYLAKNDNHPWLNVTGGIFGVMMIAGKTINDRSKLPEVEYEIVTL